MIQICPHCSMNIIPRDGRCPSCQWALDGVGGYPPPGPNPVRRRERDPLDTLAFYLRLTAWFHAFFTLLPAAFTVLGLCLVISKSGEIPEEKTMYMTVAVITYGFLTLVGAVYAVSLFWAGRSLGARKNYVPCFFIACISLLFFPFGTAVGIAAVVILLMEESKEQFHIDKEMAEDRDSFEP